MPIQDIKNEFQFASFTEWEEPEQGFFADLKEKLRKSLRDFALDNIMFSAMDDNADEVQYWRDMKEKYSRDHDTHELDVSSALHRLNNLAEVYKIYEQQEQTYYTTDWIDGPMSQDEIDWHIAEDRKTRENPKIPADLLETMEKYNIQVDAETAKYLPDLPEKHIQGAAPSVAPVAALEA